jgi:hypothetical protein
MLKIFYRSGLYSYQLRPCLNKNFSINDYSYIKGGMIATFCEDRKVTLCNDSGIPAGFFIHDFLHDFIHNFCSDDISMCSASVAVGQGEYGTDIYEPSIYNINDFLYCSSNGKITNESKYKGNIIIGIVNYVSDSDKKIGFVTCFARGLEKS